jgi:hypothetical protein
MFSDTLDADISFGYGMFSPGCRLADIADMEVWNDSSSATCVWARWPGKTAGVLQRPKIFVVDPTNISGTALSELAVVSLRSHCGALTRVGGFFLASGTP